MCVFLIETDYSKNDVSVYFSIILAFVLRLLPFLTADVVSRARDSRKDRSVGPLSPVSIHSPPKSFHSN